MIRASYLIPFAAIAILTAVVLAHRTRKIREEEVKTLENESPSFRALNDFISEVNEEDENQPAEAS